MKLGAPSVTPEVASSSLVVSTTEIKGLGQTAYPFFFDFQHNFGWTEGDEIWREAHPGSTFFDSLSSNRQSHRLPPDGRRKDAPGF